VWKGRQTLYSPLKLHFGGLGREQKYIAHGPPCRLRKSLDCVM